MKNSILLKAKKIKRYCPKCGSKLLMSIEVDGFDMKSGKNEGYLVGNCPNEKGIFSILGFISVVSGHTNNSYIGYFIGDKVTIYKDCDDGHCDDAFSII